MGLAQVQDSVQQAHQRQLVRRGTKGLFEGEVVGGANADRYHDPRTQQEVQRNANAHADT
jgi:hypothetical protein